MKKADKERQRIIEEYEIAYSKLLEIPKFSDIEVKESLQIINNDLINLIHCCKTLPQGNYCEVCKLPTDGEKCYSKRCPV
jgi:hypothetical protein